MRISKTFALFLSSTRYDECCMHWRADKRYSFDFVTKLLDLLRIRSGPSPSRVQISKLDAKVLNGPLLNSDRTNK